MTILEFDPEHGVRERLGDGSFKDDRIFFMLWQDETFRSVLHGRDVAGATRSAKNAGSKSTTTDQQTMLLAAITGHNARSANFGAPPRALRGGPMPLPTLYSALDRSPTILPCNWDLQFGSRPVSQSALLPTTRVDPARR